jgi:hypothetical protein
MEKSKSQLTPLLLNDIINVKTERRSRSEQNKHVVKWFSFCISILAIILVFEWFGNTGNMMEIL